MPKYIYIRKINSLDMPEIYKVELINSEDVYITIGEIVRYKGKEIQIIDLVVYKEGYVGAMTDGVLCVILNNKKGVNNDK